MILDAFGLLADAQAVTGTDTDLFTNVVDLSEVDPNRELGDGEPMVMAISVDVAADFTTGDETYQFDIISDDAAAMSSPTVLISRSITAANLAAGTLHYVPIPPNSISERYLSGQIVKGGTTPTITFTAFFQPWAMIQVSTRAYAIGYTVS